MAIAPITTPNPNTKEIPAGYKRTEVGVIPVDWETKRLGGVAAIKNGATPSTYIASFRNGTIPWCIPTDITGTRGKYITRTKRNITAEGLAKCGANLSPVGSLLLCSRATIGEVKITLTEICTTRGILSFVCNPDVYNEFLYYVLLTLKPQMIERAIGSTFLEILKRDIVSIQFIVPPLPEQNTIATVLSDVDRLIGALGKLIAKKKGIKLAAMQQLLTGKTRLTGFNGEWGVKRLGEVAAIKNGATPSTYIASFRNGTIPWCIPTDITGTRGKYITRTKRNITAEGLAKCGANLSPVGSLLLCSRATIGEVKITLTEICTTRGILSFVCNPDVYNEFLYYVLLTLKPQMIERAIGSTFLEILKRDIVSIQFMLPPLPEQNAIATVLSDMDAEIIGLERRRDKTEAIKRGMMQQLLTGRVRLLPPSATA